MRKFLALFVLLATFAGSAFAAVAISSQSAITSSATTNTFNSTGATAIGAVCFKNSSAISGTPTDLVGGNSNSGWVQLFNADTFSLDGNGHELYYAVWMLYGPTHVGTGHTVTCPTSTYSDGSLAFALTGTATTSAALDAKAAYEALSITTTNTGDLLFAIGVADNYSGDSLGANPTLFTASAANASATYIVVGTATYAPGTTVNVASVLASNRSYTYAGTGSFVHAGTILLAFAPAGVGNPSIVQTSLPAGYVGEAYTTTLTATGGTGTGYTYSISSAGGSACGGLSLSSGGVLSGTLTTSGTCTQTYKVTDSGSNTGTSPLSITVASALSVTTTSLPSGFVGTSYSQTLASTGGNSPISWAVTSGALPGGLSLNGSTGVISGTPTSPGTSSFQVTATDSTPTTPATSTSPTLSITISTGYTLSTSVVGSGSISGCGGSYASGAAYSCTAVAGTGYTFSAWSSSPSCGGTPSGTTYSGNMLASNCTVTATFTINSYTLTVSTSGTGTGTVSGCSTGSVAYSTAKTCTASATSGTFSGWSGTCGCTGTSGCSFNMPSNACTVIASFAAAGTGGGMIRY